MMSNDPRIGSRTEDGTRRFPDTDLFGQPYRNPTSPLHGVLTTVDLDATHFAVVPDMVNWELANPVIEELKALVAPKPKAKPKRKADEPPDEPEPPAGEGEADGSR